MTAGWYDRQGMCEAKPGVGLARLEQSWGSREGRLEKRLEGEGDRPGGGWRQTLKTFALLEAESQKG
jgi:hypothetical protein